MGWNHQLENVFTVHTLFQPQKSMSPQDMEASHRDQLTSGSEQLETQRQAPLGAVKGWDHELIAYNPPKTNGWFTWK